jgi:hypothetical protein
LSKQLSLFDVYDQALGGRDPDILAQAEALHENPVTSGEGAFDDGKYTSGLPGPIDGQAPMGDLESGMSPVETAEPAPETPEYREKTKNLLLERAKERKASSEMFQAKTTEQGKKSSY